ncbi:anthocyanin 5-aromatic acyltransferase-like [Dorcoceras hygrometricum]|uniref:Anthocyanin 5-aromatic acyltransferase-like n=1 Tax=Dorcoceras hygrometricum TaxID=472368 RepID=A0A2Z7C431_9LAMI|nr:anthocyanin 5-aromatic acyltransferase-like [Dorcoceras hygrometricum]
MASNIPKAATLLDTCRVAPSATADSAAEQRLCPTFLDMPWLNFHSIRRLLFYQSPCSKSHFLETMVPSLTKSLSKTLENYLPLSGNLLYPLGSGMPEFRYVSGDSVPVAIAESNEASDFSYLIGNDSRIADEFYPFVPFLPEPRIDSESGFKIIPLLAVQITLFPGSGICIGVCNHHSIGDASSIVGFMKAWCSNCRLGGDDESSAQIVPLPVYDRSVIKDPLGLKNLFWNQLKDIKTEDVPITFPTNLVRATFVLQKEDIQRLKNLVLSKNPESLHVSSFTVTAAYVWTCLVKAAAEEGEEVDPDETEYFAFAVDARARLNPPVSDNYFGNCLAVAKTASTHRRLKEADGFFTAVKLIGDLISKKVNNRDEILSDVHTWFTDYMVLFGKRLFSVAGSPKFNLYDMDFGWGNPKKHEAVSIDGGPSMSLSKSGQLEGALEIGLSLPKPKMDAFATFFDEIINP